MSHKNLRTMTLFLHWLSEVHFPLCYKNLGCRFLLYMYYNITFTQLPIYPKSTSKFVLKLSRDNPYPLYLGLCSEQRTMSLYMSDFFLWLNIFMFEVKIHCIPSSFLGPVSPSSLLREGLSTVIPEGLLQRSQTRFFSRRRTISLIWL